MPETRASARASDALLLNSRIANQVGLKTYSRIKSVNTRLPSCIQCIQNEKDALPLPTLLTSSPSPLEIHTTLEEQVFAILATPNEVNNATIDKPPKPMPNPDTATADPKTLAAEAGPNISTGSLAPENAGSRSHIATGPVRRIWQAPRKSMNGVSCLELEYCVPKPKSEAEMTRRELKAHRYMLFEDKTVAELSEMCPWDKNMFYRPDLIQLGQTVAEECNLNLLDIIDKWFKRLETHYADLYKTFPELQDD